MDPTLPVLGQIITTSQALQLCRQYNLPYLANRIENHPELYRSWKFDGVSGLPDRLMRLIGRQDKITYLCALPHDLAYAYGQLAGHQERRLVDQQFQANLINLAGVAKPIAKVCYLAVRLLGSARLGLSFSWGFANQHRFHISDQPLLIEL